MAIIAHEPGEHFDDTLRSVATQSGVQVGLVVIDTADSEDLPDRVKAIVPEATVLRAKGSTFPEGANRVLSLPDPLPFLLICHDDVRLESDAVVHLVTEALASNAGVIGPKLVDWDEPRRLVQVGLGSDKFAVPVSAIEPGELDQEQHDAVADVYAVPSACFLVRSDLFATLGGFDEAMESDGEDLDFGWRALAAGARVMVAPDAVVRQRPPTVDPSVSEARRLRHQLRTVLSGYGPFRTLRVLPQTLLLWLIRLITAVVTVRFGRARNLVAAWSWNLRRLGAIRHKRSELREIRQIDDGELREYQRSGSADLSRWLSDRFGGSGEGSGVEAARRSLSTSMQSGAVRTTVVTLGLAALLMLFGSRHLIQQQVPAIGELANLPSARSMLSEWWSGWWSAGLGSDAPSPTAYLLLSVLSYASLGATGFLRLLLTVGMIPLGVLGMWRVFRDSGHGRAQLVASIMYLCVPVPYNALAHGSWRALVAYAALPWVLRMLTHASGAPPFGTGDRAPSLVRSILGLGLTLALAAAVAPIVLVLAPLLVVGLAGGSLVAGNLLGIRRMATVAVGSVLVAAALHLPWSLSFVSNPLRWSPIGGTGSTEPGTVSAFDLVSFATGPFDRSGLSWALLVVAAYAVAQGRGWRLVWAIRGWFVAVVGWGLAGAAQWGVLPVPFSAPEVPLTLSAVGLAFAAGLGLIAFEADLVRHDFGWRQVLSVIAGAALVVAALPVVGASLDGRWKMPRDDYDQLFADSFPVPNTGDDSEAEGAVEGEYRVLWIGDDSVLPVAGWSVGGEAGDRGLTLGLSDSGAPTALDLFRPPIDRPTRLVREALNASTARTTSRLGRTLAPMGIRYVVIVERVAPAPFGTDVVPVDAAVAEGLAAQLDLERIEGVNQAVRLYENAAWIPTRAGVPQGLAEVPDANLANPLFADAPSAHRYTGPFEPGPEVHHAMAADANWRLVVDGRAAPRSTGYGWANRFAPTNRGDAVLEYQTPIARRLFALAQPLVWVLVFGWVVGRRPGVSDAETPVTGGERA